MFTEKYFSKTQTNKYIFQTNQTNIPKSLLVANVTKCHEDSWENRYHYMSHPVNVLPAFMKIGAC